MIEREPVPGKQGKRIAITGKGGSGKTMLTAIMTGLLSKRGNVRIIAIDADSSVSLSYALGVNVKRTVAEVRQQMIENPRAKAGAEDKHIRAIVQEILDPGDGFELLTMGRPEGPGCFCAVNDLLRYGIDTLSKQYDVTLIDCEAGPEQVNRRVVNGVDFLIIVTDTSARGMHAAVSIAEVVRRDRDMRVGQVGLVINRFRRQNEHIARMAEGKGFHVIGSVPEDAMVAEYDSLGRPLTDLPETCAAVVAVRDILTALSL
jgi:CO dehydrogenase maturation factor